MLNRKHTSAIVFLGITVLPTLMLITLQLKQWYCIHSAEERLENEALQTVILPSESLSWYKAGKEAMIAGALFDVKSYIEKDGKVILTGLFDKEETAIKRKLETERKKSASSLVLLMEIFHSFLASGKQFSLQEPQDASKAACTTLSLFYPLACSDVLIPPPRQVA
jgi:hypothetical protein